MHFVFTGHLGKDGFHRCLDNGVTASSGVSEKDFVHALIIHDPATISTKRVPVCALAHSRTDIVESVGNCQMPSVKDGIGLDLRD